MADIRGGLSWFNAHHNSRSRDSAEGVNDNFTLDRLYGIDNNSYRSVIRHFEDL